MEQILLLIQGPIIWLANFFVFEGMTFTLLTNGQYACRKAVWFLMLYHPGFGWALIFDNHLSNVAGYRVG